MTESFKYEVYIVQPNGPDDFEWVLHDSYDDFKVACMKVARFNQMGYQVKLFDPYVGKYYDENGDLINS